MISKASSFEEKVKLPPSDTISRCYQQQPHGNRKVIRILTVAVYVLCVSLAAIMLSLYYIFIWDPTIRPFVTRPNNCDKIVIPEKIAIRLLNSSEVTADQFYKHILEQYRILNQLQQQRQQFLQRQHLQLQHLAAVNKFQHIFATATIIQSNPSDPLKKPITPTNGTFLLEPRPHIEPQAEAEPNPDTVPILDTAPVHYRRKPHRKHSGSHHRHTPRRAYKKAPSHAELGESYVEQPALNPLPSSIVQQPATVYTPMPIPLILNSKEDKRTRKSTALTRKHHTPTSRHIGYETPTYMNPFLTGELIFEK